MGDRAFIAFYDPQNKEWAPAAVYLHWRGSDVRQLLTEAAPRMRAGDVSYAAARFLGHCHTKIDGALSLGMATPPKSLGFDLLADDPKWRRFCDGDNGLFLVDVRTGRVRNVAGNVRPRLADFTIAMAGEA